MNIEQLEARLDSALLINAELYKRIAEKEVKIEKLNNDISAMIQKAASKNLPAYREQGQKMLAVEEENEQLKAKIAELEKDNDELTEAIEHSGIDVDELLEALRGQDQ